MSRNGYSLIELLAVLGILSVISGIAVPRYLAMQDRTHVSVMKADLYHLRLMQERHAREGDRTYAGHALELGEAFRPSPGVFIEILDTSPQGYTAMASHEASRQRCAYSSISGLATCGRADDLPEPALTPDSDAAVGSR